MDDERDRETHKDDQQSSSTVNNDTFDVVRAESGLAGHLGTWARRRLGVYEGLRFVGFGAPIHWRLKPLGCLCALRAIKTQE